MSTNDKRKNNSANDKAKHADKDKDTFDRVTDPTRAAETEDTVPRRPRRAPSATDKIKEAGRDAGHAAKDAARDIGETVKDAGRDVGHAMKDVGHAAKDAARDVGHAAKDAARDVGHAVKDAGDKLKDKLP